MEERLNGIFCGIFRENTEADMRELLNWYQRQSVSLETFAILCWKYIYLRPFEKGNEQILQMILFKECLKHELTPFVIEVKVIVACNPVMVNLGEFVTLDKYEVLSEPVTGSNPTAMTLINEMGETHPVVNQLCIKPDGTMESKPIYAAEEAMFQGECQLMPKEKVQVWFEQNIETDTMFSKARSKAVEIDLTLKNSATVLYDKNGTRKFV